MRLKVLTINVQNDEGDYSRRVALLNRGLRDISPDLIAFQEVVRIEQRDQLAELLEGTGLHGTHQSDVMAYEPPWAERYGGNALAAEIDQIIRQSEHRRRLDYILIGSWHAHPDASARVRRASLVFDEPSDGLWPSDHFGVFAEIEVLADSTTRQDRS